MVIILVSKRRNTAVTPQITAGQTTKRQLQRNRKTSRIFHCNFFTFFEGAAQGLLITQLPALKHHIKGSCGLYSIPEYNGSTSDFQDGENQSGFILQMQLRNTP